MISIATNFNWKAKKKFSQFLELQFDFWQFPKWNHKGKMIDSKNYFNQLLLVRKYSLRRIPFWNNFLYIYRCNIKNVKVRLKTEYLVLFSIDKKYHLHGFFIRGPRSTSLSFCLSSNRKFGGQLRQMRFQFMFG